MTTERVNRGVAADFELEARGADVVKLTTALAALDGIREVETGRQD
jgi:hypothetical protein